MSLFGREQFIQKLWQILTEDSILLTAERRMGKTKVIEHLRDNPCDDYIVIYSDIEKVSTPTAFAEDILQKVKEHQSLKNQAKHYLSSFRALFDGVEIPKIIKIPDSKKSHWKAVIEHTIADVCTHNADKTILFLWDEIPYMLDNIKNQYPDANFSLEILDTLRALRQEHHNLRMIYTGSIGVHHVLTKVKIDSPIQSINDLHTARLLPIDTEDAIEMAHYRFVTKEKIAPSVERELLQKICQFCDNVPYYIKEVIAKLSIANEMPTIENIDNMLNNLLLNYSNDLNLEHFRARLKDYYTGEILDVNGGPIPRYRLAKLLLNHIAISETATIESCFSQLTHYYSLSFEHRDDLIELLTLLSKDHYLIKIDNGYQFAFSLIKRWWIEAEGLEEAVQ